MKLGIVTYNIAADWDLETIIAAGENGGYDGVELRTTHAHGVEIEMSKEKREAVKKRFNDSSVTLAGLGSAYDYHSPDHDELKQKIEGTKEYILLAKDVGTQSVKVRPNAFPEGIPKEKTIEQIGVSLNEIGTFAADHGIRIRLEVHGKETCHPPYIKQMLDIADNENVYACWNCNMADKDETGSIDKYFDMLKDKIDLVHMHDFFDDYPYERLFSLLKGINFTGFCLAEIPGSPDPERILKYYKQIFTILCASNQAEQGGTT